MTDEEKIRLLRNALISARTLVEDWKSELGGTLAVLNNVLRMTADED